LLLHCCTGNSMHYVILKTLLNSFYV
jgi:hypothetical protein